MKNPYEFIRTNIQSELDKQKTKEERNLLGQFATPNDLANHILSYAKKLLPKNSSISFLDPAIGTGSFYSALLDNFKGDQIKRAVGYEIDNHYGKPSQKLWKETNLEYNILDFTAQQIPSQEDHKFNLLICNPPYVRYQHLRDQKERLRNLAGKYSNMKLSGLSGLYCYFLGISNAWMQKDGLAGWIIPSEFMDVNYGDEVKKYLLSEVTLLHIHRFDPNELQFNDALVSTSIVWFKNLKPTKEHEVLFTYGGTLLKPTIKSKIKLENLKNEGKWSRIILRKKTKLKESKQPDQITLGDFFTVKRGIATGNNKFFILSEEQILKLHLPFSEFTPILPNPRYLKETIIESDDAGNPQIDKKLFVLDSKLEIDEIERLYPHLYLYLNEGIDEGVLNSYLVKTRKVWYKQEDRKPGLFYFTYIGRINDKRKNPFRFILNKSNAIASNSYLFLYPKEHISNILYSNPDYLNMVKNFFDEIDISKLLEEGRVYGGGMYKLEPKELAKVKAEELRFLLDGNLV